MGKIIRFKGDDMYQDAGPSYRRKEPFLLTEQHKRAIAGAIAEVDPKQIAVLRCFGEETP